MMLEDKMSTEFINRKLISCLNDKSISDFNKWIMIKQELNMFMRRKTKPFKNIQLIEHPKTDSNVNDINESIHENSLSNKNTLDFTQNNNFETPESFVNSTPKFEIKKKNIKFDSKNDNENTTINDFKKQSQKMDHDKSSKSNTNRKRRQESPHNELNKTLIEIDNSGKTKSKNKKKIKSMEKTIQRHSYNTRSVQTGESWINWISLY